jgi:hypothetical protein
MDGLSRNVCVTRCDPQGQQSKADYQHEKLMEKIKEIGPTAKVWYYPLLVGVAGTIYMNT